MTEHAVVADDASPVDDHAVLMVKPDSSPQTCRRSDLDAQDIADIAPHELVQDRGRTSQKPRETVRTNPFTEAVDDNR
jgi:hypothetical protein